MKSTRKAYGEFLCEKGEVNKNIIVFDADLSKATYTNMFLKKFPDRHFNVGISEQDLVGMAAGAAMAGKDVFASSFAMFLCGRAYEQIRNTVCYSNVKINLCATHSGLGVGEDGPTHQCIEDIALMRVIPNMKVFVPCDDISTKKILSLSLKAEGPKYIRLGRSDVEDVYNKDSFFKIGGSNTFGEGKDGTVFACGPTVQMALEAKSELQEKGINIRVVDMYSIKPIDRDVIIKSANKTKKLVAIEDHNIIGGLGSAISEVLCEEYPSKLEKIGVKDKFGKSGKYNDVYKLYNITKEEIISKFI